MNGIIYDKIMTIYFSKLGGKQSEGTSPRFFLAISSKESKC